MLLRLLLLLIPLPSLSEITSECGLYMAESSTSDDDTPAWGIYAGRPYVVGEPIGAPDIAIHLLHFRENNMIGDDVEYLQTIADWFESNVWVPDSSGARFLVEQGRVITAIPGAGVMGSFDSKLTNTKWDHQAAYQGGKALGEETGRSHPGRGAVTTFYNVGLKAVRNIVAGSEIFLDFGENWDKQEKVDGISNDEYEKVDKTIVKIIEFFQNHDALDEESKLKIYRFMTRDFMMAAVGDVRGLKITNLLPNHPDHLPDVLEAGGVLAYNAPTIYRKVAWLQENGFCLDNIQPGASTIPHAGRGAFATRRMPSNMIVAPVPLIQIPDKSVLNEYYLEKDDGGHFMPVSDEVVRSQLLINYCLGHPESNVALLLAGSTVAMINHSDEPNARLIWSGHPMNQQDWFDLSPERLVDDDHFFVGLVMEVRALRDIEEGEEITIDYGAEWKAAWDKHIERWNHRYRSGEIPQKWRISALELLQNYRDRPFKTIQELAVEPYASDVSVMGFLMLYPEVQDGTLENPRVWDLGENNITMNSDHLFELEVISYEPVEDELSPFNYTIRWTNSHGHPTFVKNVPHRAIIFVDDEDSNDQFTVQEPFRHYIGIPDEMFPERWRDKNT